MKAPSLGNKVCKYCRSCTAAIVETVCYNQDNGDPTCFPAPSPDEPQVEVVNVMFHSQNRNIVANTTNVITVEASQS